LTPEPPEKKHGDPAATAHSSPTGTKGGFFAAGCADPFAAFFKEFGGGNPLQQYPLAGDADGDGALSSGEVARQWGSDERALAVTSALDTSRDGTLDKAEIDAARRVLFPFDSDREAYATRLLVKHWRRGREQTSKALAVAWTPAEVAQILAQFDTDADGSVTTAEILANDATLETLRRIDQEDREADDVGADDDVDVYDDDAPFEAASDDDAAASVDDDDDPRSSSDTKTEGVVGRFVRTFFFGYLTPAADVRRMWSVLKWLRCECLEVEADTENVVGVAHAPCLFDAQLDRHLRPAGRGGPSSGTASSSCVFEPGSTVMTKAEFDAAIADSKAPHLVSSSDEQAANADDDENDDAPGGVLLTFDEFEVLMTARATPEVAGAVSHLIYAGQLDMARTLLLQELAVLLRRADPGPAATSPDTPNAVTSASPSSKSDEAAESTRRGAAATEDDDADKPPKTLGGGGEPWRPPPRSSDQPADPQTTTEPVCVRDKPTSRSSFPAVVHPKTGAPDVASWDRLLRDRGLARLRAWLAPTVALLVGLAVAAVSARRHARLDASARDFDQIRAYLAGYFEYDDDTRDAASQNTASSRPDGSRRRQRRRESPHPIAVLLAKPHRSGGLAPLQYGPDTDVYRAAYAAGRALASHAAHERDDDDVDGIAALAATEIAALLRQTRTNSVRVAGGGGRERGPPQSGDASSSSSSRGYYYYDSSAGGTVDLARAESDDALCDAASQISDGGLGDPGSSSFGGAACSTPVDSMWSLSWWLASSR